MATRIFRGDAPTQAQIRRIKQPLVAGVVTVRIGNKTLTFDAWSPSAIATAWNSSTWPEFREVLASASGNDLLLTARTAGVPFFVHIAVGDAGPGDGRNEVQIITLLNNADGGTFNVSFGGDDLDVDWDVDGDELQTALESLSSLEPGDVAVEGDAAGPWTITFGGRFANENVPLIVVNGTNLTGGNALAAIVTVQDGGGTSDPLEEEVLPHHYGYAVFNQATETLENAFSNVPMLFGGLEGSDYERYWHTWMSFQLDVPRGATISYAALQIAKFGLAAASGWLYAEAADNPSVPSTGPTSNLLTRPLTTARLALEIPAGTWLLGLENFGAVVQEIVNRPGWQSGNRITLHLRATSLTGFGTIEEPDVYANRPRLQVFYTSQLSEIQTVQLLGGNIRSGTVTLTLDDQTAAPLNHNATAGQAQAAVAALSNVGSGQVSCSGGPWPAPITFAFASSLGNLPQMTAVDDLVNASVQASTLQQGGVAVEQLDVQRSRGPNHWDDPLNWEDESGGFGVPQRLDMVYLPHGKIDLLYGIRQRCRFTASEAADRLFLADGQAALQDGQAVEVRTTGTLPAGLAADTTYYVRDFDPSGPSLRLATTPGGLPVAISAAGTGTHEIGVRFELLETDARFTGKLGLPKVNRSGSYQEYRPRFLEAWVDRLTIGRGEGSGSQRFHADTGDRQTFLQLHSSQGSADGAPAVQWIGSHADNSLEILSGNVGIAIDPEQAAVFSELKIRGGQVLIGRNVEAGDIERTGGNVRMLGATVDGTVTL